MARQENFTSKPDFTKIGLDNIDYNVQVSPMTEIKVQV
jgi:hypothetical protein